MKAAPTVQPLLTFGQCLKNILGARKLSASALSRMMEQKSAQRLYAALGHHLKYADGWKKYIITSEPEFEHYFGKQATKKRKLYNGRLQCNVYMYF